MPTSTVGFSASILAASGNHGDGTMTSMRGFDSLLEALEDRFIARVRESHVVAANDQARGGGVTLESAGPANRISTLAKLGQMRPHRRGANLVSGNVVVQTVVQEQIFARLAVCAEELVPKLDVVQVFARSNVRPE